jgi:hypothetical protein
MYIHLLKLVDSLCGKHVDSIRIWHTEVRIFDIDALIVLIKSNLKYGLEGNLNVQNSRCYILLQSKLNAAESTPSKWVREQLTIMKVNTARIYNWDVKQRQKPCGSKGSKHLSRFCMYLNC